MHFYIGENVIYPPYGIAVIANITERSFGSVSELCYQLRVYFRNITAIVPAQSARAVGLRKLANQADTKRVLAFLGNDTFPTCADWKSRARENAIRLQSGDLLQTAEVYKGLTLVGGGCPGRSWKLSGGLCPSYYATACRVADFDPLRIASRAQRSR